MGYLYQHTRKDTGQVFYVGISLNEDNYKRAFDKRRRNKYWKSIVNKTDYNVEILYKNLSVEEVKVKEKEIISLYGRKDLGTGILANLTDGGEGVVGYKHTKEALLKLTINSSMGNNPKARACIHFETLKEFSCLKEGCNYFNLKYLQQVSAISRKNATAKFYFVDAKFEKPIKKDKNKTSEYSNKNNHG